MISKLAFIARDSSHGTLDLPLEMQITRPKNRMIAIEMNLNANDTTTVVPIVVLNFINGNINFDIKRTEFFWRSHETIGSSN